MSQAHRPELRGRPRPSHLLRGGSEVPGAEPGQSLPTGWPAPRPWGRTPRPLLAGAQRGAAGGSSEWPVAGRWGGRTQRDADRRAWGFSGGRAARVCVAGGAWPGSPLGGCQMTVTEARPVPGAHSPARDHTGDSLVPWGRLGCESDFFGASGRDAQGAGRLGGGSEGCVGVGRKDGLNMGKEISGRKTGDKKL